MAREKCRLSLADVRAQALATHGRLVDFFSASPRLTSPAMHGSVAASGSTRMATTRFTPRPSAHGDSGR
jgi:hypothetical protein